MTFIDFNEEFL